MYSVKNSHEAIIDKTTFDAVQAEMARRAEKYAHTPLAPQTYPFTGMLTCGICGKHYRRKVTATGPVWICATYNTLGKVACPSKQIPEETLMCVTAEVVGTDTFDANAFHDNITAVKVLAENTVVFAFKDGHEAVKQWQDRSRSQSWTEDMKQRAAEKTKERHRRCQQQRM